MEKFEAGVWEQYREEDGGDGLSVRSRHGRMDLAIKAATRYARESSEPTGGPLSWSGGVRGPDGRVVWYDRAGEVVWTP